jgi:hypothetical protein
MRSRLLTERLCLLTKPLCVKRSPLPANLGQFLIDRVENQGAERAVVLIQLAQIRQTRISLVN